MTAVVVIVMMFLSIGSMLPFGLLVALLFGGSFKLLVFVIVAGVGTGLVGWGLTLYIQKTKADTPSGYLFQRLRVTLFPKKWKPPVGDFHYRRTRKF